MSLSLSVENISKRFLLGNFGAHSAIEDIRAMWERAVVRWPDASLNASQENHNDAKRNAFWALRNVSFTACQGEVVGVIGKNGSGKSTLLKILSQITTPTAGRVRVNGRLASLLEVGTGFHNELSGRENIFRNGAIIGMTPREIRRKFDEIVHFAEIEEFIDTPVKRYSSGMAVRLAFAVAAHLETDIMIVDEVLAVGDVGFQRKCLGTLADATATGRTVLFVSHRMDHVTALCPRSVVLDAGRLVYDGPTNLALAYYYRQFDEGENEGLSRDEDRKGRGRVRVVNCWIETAGGAKVETIATGQPVVFKMRIKNMTGKIVRNLDAGIELVSLNNIYAAALGSREGGLAAIDVEDEVVVSLRVPRFTLNQGQFYLNCTVRSAAGGFTIEDRIEGAKTLTVDHGDFHGIGHASEGFVAIEHSANIETLRRHDPHVEGRPSPIARAEG